MSDIKPTHTLIKKWRKLMSADWRKQAKQRKALHKLMRSMRVKQKVIEQDLARCEDDDLKKVLEAKLALIKEKRRKGLKLLEALRRGELPTFGD